MVLTNAQVTSFFTAPDQMGLDARTRVHLQSEGIINVEDLAEFSDDDNWKQVLENCRKPPKVLDANGVLVEQEAFHIGAKSLHRLKVAAIAVEYYLATDRPLTAAGLQWETPLKNFETQWKAILHLKDQDPELPKLSKTVGIVKWLEAYESYALHKLGVRNAPLAYVIRETSAVPAAPVLTNGQPHSDEHGSVKAEMVARLSHGHGLFRDDNAAVFDDIEEAVRGTKFHASIAPFRRAKDGRGAYMALKEQHAGKAMWDKEAKLNMDFLLNRKFTGGTAITLERFMAQHRQAYVSLQKCAEHIQLEVPNERTRVGYLLENIEVSDPEVRAAISSIKLDDNAGGLRNDFERAVAFLLPVDPVAKKNQRGTKRGGAAAEISATDLKQSRGPKTGVEIRYYTTEEYKKLSADEQAELRELRQSKRRKTGGGGSNKGRGGTQGASPQSGVNSAKFRASLVTAITKQLREEEEKQRTAIEAIAGILKTSQASISGTGGTVPNQVVSNGGAKAPAPAASGRKSVEEVNCEVAATKLYGLMQEMNVSGKSSRKGGKSGKKGSS